jgi:serine/threonine protein kinase/predicted ATPase
MADVRHPLEDDSAFAARFTLDAPLGAGGFASVFRGTQRSTGQSVAVKILDGRAGADASVANERLARFRREMRLCANLHHPNLVRLIDAGTGAGAWLFCVFEYVPGRSLDRLLLEEGALDPAEATRLMAQVLDAIGCAHRHGIVHRDLKPSNVMINEAGLLRHALVLDFGVGALAGAGGPAPVDAQAGDAPGTPAYAAPEQLRGEAAKVSSDLYSWGLIALECLTGAPAIRGSSLEEVLGAQLGPQSVDIPDALRALPLGRAVAAAVAKRPEERAPSAEMLLAMLVDLPTPRSVQRSVPLRPGVASEGRQQATRSSVAPMIGRDEELHRLEDAWKKVREGAPDACLVAGEAGIGKSRLLRELRHRVGTRSWIECRCTPETQHSPFKPVVDWLADWARATSLEEILAELGIDAAETHPLLAELLGLPGDARFPSRPLAPERKRERTMQAIQDLLFAAARRRPLAFVIEDLHWADPTTLEFLAALVRELRTAGIFAATPDLPLLVLFSARPDFAAPWSLPEVPRVELARLGRRDAENLARAATSGAKHVSDASLDRLLLRADGIPLFLEEMGRMMSESAAVGPDALEREVPATLGKLLGSRIDRLHSEARRTIQTAACLGRDFELSLLQAVSERAEGPIRDDLDSLIRAGLLFRRSRSRPERFLFHHSLLRDVAHDSMELEERRGAHLRIATTLQGPGFGEIAVQQPERLAYHFEEAGQVDPAIDFRRRAGRRHAAGSAYREAVHHFGRALDLLRTLAESPERDTRELDLQLSIGNAFSNTQGYAAESVERSFERALVICNRFPEAPPLFSAVNGLWGYHLVRGDPDTTRALVARQRDLATRSAQMNQRLLATHAEGATAFYAGDLVHGLAMLTEATSLYEVALEEYLGRGERRPWRSPASSAPMYLGWCLHLVGRPDAGLARQTWALERAERLPDAYAHVEAMTHLVALLHDRREPEKTLELSDRIVGLSEELGFRFWLGIGKSARGWARSQLGELDAGSAEIEEGLEIFRRTGSMVPLVYRLSYLVEAHLRAERLEQGLAVIDLAFERSRGRLDRFYDAEMRRLRGEILHRAGETARAEVELERAVGFAREHGARLHELRAATSLARLRAATGRRDDARRLLEPIYRSFEEGFTTPDLRDAAACLSEL